MQNNVIEPKFYIKHPNLENEEINKKYNELLFINFFSFNIQIENFIDKQEFMDCFYNHITNSISNAYNMCKQTISINNKTKNNKWFTNELKIIKEEMIVLRRMKPDSKDELKILKKLFKKTMKRNIKLYEKNEFYKISKLIKETNSDKFFKKVKQTTNKKNMEVDMNIDNVAQHYDQIFNDPLNVKPEIIASVIDNNKDIILNNFYPINLNLCEFKLALKMCSNSKVCGNDSISSYMINGCETHFIESIIYKFFCYIFQLSIIPKDFNFTHIIPIIKDITKPTNTINNLRPISISNTFAQIFERILLHKLPILNQTHQNQFGYKTKTSCTHVCPVCPVMPCLHLKKQLLCI